MSSTGELTSTNDSTQGISGGSTALVVGSREGSLAGDFSDFSVDSVVGCFSGAVGGSGAGTGGVETS
jgi:hypothetical protein